MPPDSPRPDFCCRGCEVVHALLVEQGLTRFYDLAGGQSAPAEPPRDRSYAWLEPLVEGAEAGSGEVCSLSLDVQGIHCAACVWLMNEMFRRRQGGAGITVNPALGKVRMAWRRGRFDVPGYLAEIERFGYLFGPDRKRADAASRALPIRIGICAAVTINVMLFSTSFYLGLGVGDPEIFKLFSRLEVIFSALVMVVGGQVFFTSAWRALRRGVLHLDLPIAVGIVLAFGASFLQAVSSGGGDVAYFDTLNVFVTLMLVGRWLQQRVVDKNRRFLVEDDGADGLLVRRREGDHLALIKAPLLRKGDLLVVAPGDCVPVDSLLIDPHGSFSTDWITGEPEIRSLVQGQTAPAGAFNAGRSAVTLCARTDFAESPLPALLRAPVDAAGSESGVPAHARFFDRWARFYVAAVLAVAGGAALLWWRLDPARAIDVTVAVLVVTCPCAVGLAAPLAMELATARLRRVGLFVKSGDFLERLTRVRKLLFDKTGTLTLGRLSLVGGDAPGELPPALRDAAYDMAARSIHPVSRCLTEALARAGARFDGDARCTEETGRGLELDRGGHRYRLGSAAWALEVAGPADEPFATEGATVLSVDGVAAATFVTAEEVRPDAGRELAGFAHAGYGMWLISGDGQPRVDRLAAALGIPAGHALGGQRPEDKARAVAAIDRRDTLYLGDGVNDSLAFSAAFCAGTTAIDRPVLPGRADFFLLGEGLAPIRSALELALQLRGVLRRNLILAAVYNVAAVAFSIAGWMTPLRAAVAMPLSSLLLLYLTTRSLSPERTAAAASRTASPVPLQEAA